AEIKKRGGAPATFHAPANHAVTAASANDEASLDHVREYRDGLRSIQKLLRNCAIGHIHYFSERVGSFLRVLGSLGRSLRIGLLRDPEAGRKTQNRERNGRALNHSRFDCSLHNSPLTFQSLQAGDKL